MRRVYDPYEVEGLAEEAHEHGEGQDGQEEVGHHSDEAELEQAG